MRTRGGALGADGFLLLLEVADDTDDAGILYVHPGLEGGGSDVSAASVVVIDDETEVVDVEGEVASHVLDLRGEQAVGVGTAVLGLDDDEDAGVTGFFVVAAAPVVGGGVHAEAEAGRAVDEDDVVVVLDWAQSALEGCFAGTDGGEADVEKEGVGAGGQDVKPVAEAGLVDGDDEVGQFALGFAGHVVGEGVSTHGERLVSELLGEVALRVEVDEEDALPETGKVFQGEQVLGAVLLFEEGREVLGDTHRDERGRVFGEGFAEAGGDGGLADSALLVADDEAPDRRGALDLGHGVVVEPESDGLGDALGEGDAAVLAVVAETVPHSGGEEGGVGLGAGGVDGGGVRAQATPGDDAGFDGVLHVEAVEGGTDLEVLPESAGEFGDDLLPVAARVR